MTKFTKLQIIKHALQYYIQRDGATVKDKAAEMCLLAEVEENLQKLISHLGIIVNGAKPLDPLLVEWDQKKNELRKIIPTPGADWIINEIKPEANQYTLPVAVGRLNVFIHLALKGIDESELLAAAKNYREDLLLYKEVLSSPLSEIHFEGDT